MKKVGETTRPFRYDLNQIPYDYTVEVRNKFKGLDLIECLMNYGRSFMALYRRQGLRSSPREGNGNPLQYSCLENPMARKAWQATECGVTKSQTRLSYYTKIALEPKVSFNLVPVFQFPKFLEEFEWPCLSQLPTLGLVTKGMDHMFLGLLSKYVLQKCGVGKRE